MEYFRYCKVCDEINPDSESDCCKCGTSILDVISEPKRNVNPPKEIPLNTTPIITFSLQNGDEITVSSGDSIGRSICGKDQLKDFINVSRKHATIQNIDGIWVVKDEKTLNGTFINGERIEPGIWKKIKDGDCLGLSPVCPMIVKIR